MKAEYTKGKLSVSQMYDDGSIHIHGGDNKDYICSVQIKQIGGGAIAEVMEAVRLANAQELVKRWNCHEGLVAIAKEFRAIMKARIPDQILPREYKQDRFAEIEAALAGAEK